MGELDRVAWAGGIAFLTHGIRVGIRVDDPAVLDRLPPHLPPGFKPLAVPVVKYLYSLRVARNGRRQGGRRPHRLYTGPNLTSSATDLEQTLDDLAATLDFAVSVSAQRHLFVHAGVVGWRGRAILIPGRSGSGKTTLVAALVRGGATYYSDEFAVLDANGRVHPYARRLALRKPGMGSVRRCPVEELGGRAGRRPLPVGLIAVTEHRPGGRWRPRALSRGQALLALLDNTVLARHRPEAALHTLRRAVGSARAIRSRRSEAAEVVASLLDA
jgi:hypothetical protein